MNETPLRLKTGYQVLLLVALSLLVYYPTLFSPLNTLDDQVFTNVLMNQQGFSLSRHFIPAGAPEYYRPLLTLTFEVDKFVGGLQNTFMHLVNILLHVLNVVLVFFVARVFQKYVGPSDDLLPLCAACLFALHPLNTEAVNWIAGRTDLLAGSFVLASLFCLLKALERYSLIWGAASALLLLGGSLCKETALFMVPGALLVLFWRFRDKKQLWRRRLVLPLMMVGSVATYFAMRYWGLHHDRGISHTLKAITDISTGSPVAESITRTATLPEFPLLVHAVRVAIKATGFYTCKLFQPIPLNFAIDHISELYLIPGIIVLVVLAIFIFRRRPVDTFFLLSAGIGGSALLAIFAGVTWTPIAERYMYIPSGPFVIASVFAAAPWIKRLRSQNVARTVFLAILLGAAWGTVARNFVWQDNLTLYQDTVQKSPDFTPAKAELARVLYAHGRTKEADALTLSFTGRPNQASSLNQAATLVRQGSYDDARTLLRDRVAEHDRLERQALDMLIKITAQMVDNTADEKVRRQYHLEMVEWLSRLIELSNNPFHWYRLGRVHLWLGNPEEAKNCFTAAARLFPENSPYLEPSRKLVENLSR